MVERNRFLSLTPEEVTFTGPQDRFQKNLAALKLLHTLATTGREPSLEERRILAHFSAFGESAHLNRLFRYDQAQRRYVLAPSYQPFLTEEEGHHLRKAALTAFYTPLDLVSVIWQALLHLGLGALDRPHILEPTAGIGHFIAAMPADLRARSAITAVECDPLAARIFGYLHPDVTLHGGSRLEEVTLPSQSFDLVVSNVPFGHKPVNDPTLPAELRRTLHDYVLAKAMTLVRPGGLVVVLTSWGTLDKQTTTVRTALAAEATLLGAWRLRN